MKSLLHRTLALLACSLGWVLPQTLSAQAQVPNLISHQGRVAVNGVNFDGTGRFKFALVNADGSTSYWSNDGTSTSGSEPVAAVSLPVTKGLYSVMLGDTTDPHPKMAALSANVFSNADLRLRVWFNDGTLGFQQLSPDQRIAPNGYLPAGSVAAGSLADGSITAAKITPGTVIPSQAIAGTAHTMDANTRYVATGDGLTTFTLPSSASIGDVVQIAGTGSGGWSVIPPSGQSIATPWIPRETVRRWRSVASSADGTKLVAVVLDGQIYTSTDSGVSWTPRESVRRWRSVASSADGTKLVAVTTGSLGQIYTSSDSGATWTPHPTLTGSWLSVASSADGTKLVVVDNQYPYTSNDSGVTWTQRQTEFGSLRYVASSADGSKLVAVGTRIYTGSDTDEFWTTRESARFYSFVASSADGSKLVALASAGQIYTSTDSGISWTPRETDRYWNSVASSADGSKLVASVNQGFVANDGQIYTSTDSGLTWTPRESNRDWTSVASSADGNKLVAVVDGGRIYTSAPVGGGQGQTATLQYLGGGEWTHVGITGNGAGLTGIDANTLTGSVPPTALTAVPAESLVGSVPATSLTSVPAGSLIGSLPATALGSLPAENLIGSVPPATLTSVPAGSLTGSVPATALGSVPAESLIGSVPPLTLTSVPAARLTGSVPPASLTSVPAGSLTGSVPPDSLTSIPAANLAGAVPPHVLISVPAGGLTGSVPPVTLTSVPAANLTGSVPPASLTSVPAGSLTGSVPPDSLTSVPPAALTSVPAASLTGSVPSAALTSVPAASLTGSVPPDALTSVPAGNLTGSVPPTALTSVPADNLTGSISPALLTSIPAAILTGTILDSRLTSNVALRSGGNAFTGNQSIVGNLGIGTNAPGQMLQVGDVNTPDSQGMMRFASRSGTGPSSRYWDIGVPEGDQNTSGKNYSFVIDDPESGGDPEMTIRWDTGNVGIGIANPTAKLDVNGAYLRVVGGGNEQAYIGGDGSGGDVEIGSRNPAISTVGFWNSASFQHMNVVALSFNPTSDRNLKENFEPVDAREVLEKVAAMPISRWNFKGDAGTPHLGPMAQDFHAAFGTGADDKHIATVDADGVALAAIQGLNEKLKEKDSEIADLISETLALREENQAIEARLAALEELLSRQPSARAKSTTRPSAP